MEKNKEEISIQNEIMEKKEEISIIKYHLHLFTNLFCFTNSEIPQFGTYLF